MIPKQIMLQGINWQSIWYIRIMIKQLYILNKDLNKFLNKKKFIFKKTSSYLILRKSAKISLINSNKINKLKYNLNRKNL